MRYRAEKSDVSRPPVPMRGIVAYVFFARLNILNITFNLQIRNLLLRRRVRQASNWRARKKNFRVQYILRPENRRIKIRFMVFFCVLHINLAI